MASDESVETVATNPLGALLGDALPVGAIAGLFGGAVGSPVAAGLLGVGPVAGAGVAFLATVTAALALAVVAGIGRRVRFHDDRVVVTGGLFGTGGGSARYDEVELVVRKLAVGDRAFGTATFEALRHGDDLTVRYVRDPGTVERLFGERVAPPRDRIRAARTDDEPVYFWDHWSDDHEPPDGPVVERSELGEILGVDPHVADLDALDEVGDLDEFDDLGDLDDVAGDFGEAGGDGEGGGGDDGGGE